MSSPAANSFAHLGARGPIPARRKVVSWASLLDVQRQADRMSTLAETLKTDSANLFTPSGMDLSIYADDVEFQDPITKHADITGFVNNLRFLKAAFDPTYEMLDIRQISDTELEARWTMGFDVVPIKRSPLGKFWQPRLEFTGTTVYGIDRDSGLIARHIDTWDSIANQEYFSVEAFGDVWRQIFNFQRTPQLKGPQFKLLKRKRDYSIREYEPFTVAEMSMETSGAVGKGNGQTFSQLAKFLFGGNVSGTRLDMTTPVITSDAGNMQFILPVASVSDAPSPLPGSKVRVTTAEGGLYAALRFAGAVTDEVAASKRDELAAFMRRDGLQGDDGFLLLRYNDPSVKPPFRRNEILIPIVSGFDLWNT